MEFKKSPYPCPPSHTLPRSVASLSRFAPPPLLKNPGYARDYNGDRSSPKVWHCFIVATQSEIVGTKQGPPTEH